MEKIKHFHARTNAESLTTNSCTIKMFLKTCSEEGKMISEQNLRRKKKQ